MGVMDNVSLKDQVRSFFYSSSVLMILPFFVRLSLLISFSPSYLFCLPCQCFLIRSFAASPRLLHFGVIMDKQGLRPPPPLSLRRPAMTSSTDVLVQPSTTAPSVPHLPTRTIVYTRSLITFNSHLNVGVHIVAEFCLCEP